MSAKKAFIKQRGTTGIYWLDIPAHASPTGRRLRQSTGTSNKAEAQRILRETLTGSRQITKAPRVTLEAACERGLRSIWGDAKSLCSQEGNARAWIKLLGPQYPIAEVDATVIDEAIATMQSWGNAPGTINRRLSFISRLLREAEEVWQVIGRRPKVRKLKGESRRTRTYTREEERSILSWAVAHDKPLYDLAFALFQTGLRVSEALRVDPQEDIGLTGGGTGWLIVRESKSGNPRTIPVSAEVAAMWTRYLPFRDADEVAKRWKQMRVALGYAQDAEFVAHTVRHTVATRLLQGGMDVAKVQAWLGHKKIETTLRYLHLVTRDIAEGSQILAGHTVAGAEFVSPVVSKVGHNQDEAGTIIERNPVVTPVDDRLLITRSAVRARPGEPHNPRKSLRKTPYEG